MSETKVVIGTDKENILLVNQEKYEELAPKSVAISGNIEAPKEFYQKRKEWIDSLKLKTHVLVNLNTSTVDLVVDENNPFDHYRVTGKMVLFKDFVDFGINTGAKLGKQKLIDLLKQNKMYFTDKKRQADLLMTFQKFVTKISTNMENSHTPDGKRKLLEEYSGSLQGFRVNGQREDFDPSFILEMPIFVGEKSRQFTVQICLDPTNHGLEFYLESEDLWEVAKKAAAEGIENAIAPFIKDFAVIYV
jgi:hypothetical protein